MHVTEDHGKDLQPIRFHVSDESARFWARLLDDENPIHNNSAGAINPGPANMSYLMTLLLRAFPEGRIETIDCRFVAPVVAPVTVEASGMVQTVVATPLGNLFHCSLELRSAGLVAVTAHARVLTASAPLGSAT